jgi:hypothetical protein
MATLETLEERLTAVEQEVTRLTAALRRLSPPREPGDESRVARLIRQAEESRAATIAAAERVMKRLGIEGPPIDAKAVRESIIAGGLDPSSNEFSRELIAMREE